MTVIRSIIFWILIYISVILLVLCYFPLSLVYKKENLADICAKIWSQTALFLLRTLLNITYEIKGLEKIPNRPCIIASKHQSMWDTMIFHITCRYPAFVYKKELLKIPVYGWYISQMSGLKIDREGGASALKDLIKSTKALLAKNHNIIIFPQGTRVPYGAGAADYPYQVGVAAIYLAGNVEVVPANLDSGKHWGKSMIIKPNGTITIEFLDPISPGLKKEEFLQKLENAIEEKSKIVL